MAEANYEARLAAQPYYSRPAGPQRSQYMLSNGSVVWVYSDGQAQQMQEDLNRELEADRIERDFEEWERELEEYRREMTSAGDSSHDVDVNELLGLASILPGGSSCSIVTHPSPPPPTAKDGLGKKPVNDKPIDNGDNDLVNETVKHHAPPASKPGDTPTDPLQVQAQSNPVTAATSHPALPVGDSSSRLALPAGNNRLALSTALGRGWQAGEDYARNMYGGKATPFKVDPEADAVDRFPITDTGLRNVDSASHEQNGTILAVEVKSYRRFLSKVSMVDGEEVVSWYKNSVSLRGIEHQIAKDVALRSIDPSYDPRWVFMGAGPAQDTADRLNEAGIIYVWHNPY
ncbi:hypothetical protein ABT095_26440 [Kitasatospora sp. NPDC002227]|uniref:hypothetical protein n=1 Tax=Kitasatospora sp. NPDC002227 TaxID=3154773 RepID=UPI0033209141